MVPAVTGRVRVAVVFGGRSSEHSVSCVSAGSVLAALDRDKYDVVAIGITRDGRWVLADDDAQLAIEGRSLPSIKDGAALTIPADPATAGYVVLEPGQIVPGAQGIDVVFPLLHGPYGEDGTVQGLLELAGIPYVGSGVLSSAVSMDKEFMKIVLAARGLDVGPHVVVSSARWKSSAAQVRDEITALGWPVFVKPARGGSSIGISKVSAPAGLDDAIAAAQEHDPKVLVEAIVHGREVECAVLGGLAGSPPQASLPAEVHVAGDWYDFEAKYLEDATQFSIPADLPAALTERIQALACEAFTALDCAGLARVDFFIDTAGNPVINEVNTMPGFTPMSMYPRMWAATGVDYPALVDRLLQLALERRTGLH
jgi:D-alanine-D-alanine ligase